MYARGLERAEYGVIEYVLVLQVLVQVVIGMELTQGIARFYGGAGTDAERRAYASTGLWSLIIAYGVACGVMFATADLLERALFDGTVPGGVLRPAIASVLVAILFYAVRSQLRWELRPMRYAVAGVIAAVITVGLSAYFVLAMRAGLFGAFAATAIGNGLALVWCLSGLSRTYSWTFDAGRLLAMLRFSAPLTASTLALFAANWGDRIVIRTGMGFDDLGTYAAGAKVASAIAIATAGFQLGAAPLVYRHHERSDTPEALAQLLRMFFGVALIGVLGLAALSPEVITLIATPAYVEAWRIVAVLALATVLASGYIFLPGLTLRNMTARFAAINVAAAALALTLMGILVGGLGIAGAALGVLAGAAAGFAAHAFASHRVYPLPVAWARVGLGIALVTIAIGLTWALDRAGPLSLTLRVLTAAVAAVGVAGLVLSRPDRALIGRIIAAHFARTRAAT